MAKISFARHHLLALLVLLALLAGAMAQPAAAQRSRPATYSNPLPVLADGALVESCADPAVIHGATPDDTSWYMYCTTDPLNSADRDPSGGFNFRLIPTFRSDDLVSWSYVGDAFATRPTWVADDAGLWAPDVQFFNGQYYLYYTASWTDLPGGGSAIGVATSSSPTGPWLDSGGPVVEPHAPPCCADAKRWVFDASIIADDSGQRYIFYGSYFGGIAARPLSADGLSSVPGSQTQIDITNRYEGAYVVRHDGFYYLFASATDCCRGPLTGYSVFVGRSANPLGPYLDREGASFLAGRVGGTPVLSMNGNRWVGTGHNAVITDFAGQDWIFYHAIDRNDPYFAGAVGFTKRPVLLDRLDWVDGWPTTRGGRWASDEPQPGPAAQPGERGVRPIRPLPNDRPGKLIAALSDEFDGTALRPRWRWVRPPASGFGVGEGVFRFETQAADLFEGSNSASVLLGRTLEGNYLVETRVKLNLPPEGCCFNFVQAGLLAYGDDDNFIKLAHVSIWETRQTEFAKEQFPVPAGYPRYGNTVVTAPDEWTYLRIARRAVGDEQQFTAYVSRDGVSWNRGGTWTHNLEGTPRIGLVAMGGAGFTAEFDYVRVYKLR